MTEKWNNDPLIALFIHIEQQNKNTNKVQIKTKQCKKYKIYRENIFLPKYLIRGEKTEQVSIDCSIHPVWTHLSSEHWHFKILSSVNREIKMRFSAHTNRKISIGQTQFAFDGENASSISSWSFLISLRTSEKAKLFEHFYPFSWILSRWHWWCCSSRGNPGSPQTSTFPLETKRCQINFLRSAMTKFPRILNWILLQEIAHSLFTLQKFQIPIFFLLVKPEL